MWPPYSKDVSVRVIVTSSRFKAECREYSVRLSENNMIDRMEFNALEPVNSSIALKLRRWMITRVRGTTLPRECRESRRGCKKALFFQIWEVFNFGWHAPPPHVGPSDVAYQWTQRFSVIVSTYLIMGPVMSHIQHCLR